VDSDGSNNLKEDVLSVVDIALSLARLAKVIVEAVGALVTNTDDGESAAAVAGNALVNVVVRGEGNIAGNTANSVAGVERSAIGHLTSVLSGNTGMRGSLMGEVASGSLSALSRGVHVRNEVLHCGGAKEGVQKRLQLREDVLELRRRESLSELRAERIELRLEVGLRIGLLDLGLLRLRSGSGSGSGSRSRSRSRSWSCLRRSRLGNRSGLGGFGLRLGSLAVSLQLELNNNSLRILGTSQRVSLEEFVVRGDGDEVAVVVLILDSEVGRKLLEESLEECPNRRKISRSTVVSNAANVAVK